MAMSRHAKRPWQLSRRAGGESDQTTSAYGDGGWRYFEKQSSFISPARHVVLGLNSAIRPFLKDDHSFGPEEIAKMSAAFDGALRKLGLVDRNDPAATDVAKPIIEFAKADQRGPERLCALTLQELPK